MFSKFSCLLVVLIVTQSKPLSAQKYFADDPIAVDRDNLIDVGTPKRQKLSDYYDFLENTFATPGDLSKQTSANVNTLGEVPDSSWFQNRHGRNRMTADELVRGPNKGTGPSIDGPWVVIAGKSEGITPGFSIRDSRGDIYVIKFDPVSNPEMATSAETIVTKFFHAIGYYVPENYLVFFNRGDVRVGPDAELSVGLGPRRRMNEKDLDDLLERTPMTPDKRYRAVASKFVEGEPIGPFKYFGTRPDDPNDVIPHENRRELRGLRVFSAWLNHDDSRAVNTLDTVVTEGGTRFVRHYLIDFGSTLGSGSVQAQKPRAGWEYLWQPGATFSRLATLGLVDREWVRVHYPDFPSLGRFESKKFRPERWKPEYPNVAFKKSLPDDEYWAARIVMAFTDEDIRALVRTGGLSDPKAEQYLVQTLIERRNKIGQYCFKQVLAIDNFVLKEDAVNFAYTPTKFGFESDAGQYRLSWFRLNNATGEKTPVGNEVSIAENTFRIPAALLEGPAEYFGVEIREAQKAPRPKGESPAVSVFISRSSPTRIVGIERTGSVE
jgi:hypothetical protein